MKVFRFDLDLNFLKTLYNYHNDIILKSIFEVLFFLQNMSMSMYHTGVPCMNSGFCHDVEEKSALLGYYKASSNNFFLIFRDNLSVPSSREIGPIFKGLLP